MNRHPVDRPADLRQQMGTLEKDAEAIRADILTGESYCVSGEHCADFSERPRA